MIQVMGKVKIQDLATFVSIFATQGAVMRKKFGSQSGHLYRVIGQHDQVIVLFDWESQESFQNFVNDPSVKETMKLSGTLGPPEFTFLEKVADFPS
jgi:heme-degrading monooxygenase HmoA